MNMDNSVIKSNTNAVKSFIEEDDGDTNFISIIIILAIALVVGGLFLGFKDQIIEWVKDQLQDSPFLKKDG